MKIKPLYFVLCSLLIISGCTQVYFSQPQPQNKKSLKQFPSKYHGMYLSIDKDTFCIGETFYTLPEKIEKTIAVAEMDSIKGISLSNDLLYDDSLPLKKGIPYSILEDSIHYEAQVNWPKYISDSLVLKKLSNRLIISSKSKNNPHWEVYILEQLKNENIKLYAIGNFKTKYSSKKIKYDGELKEFYDVTSFVAIENKDYLIDPSKREFKKLIKKGFFKEIGEITKIEKSNKP